MDEYIYDPDQVLEAKGSGFSTLRRKLSKLKDPDISLFEFSPEFVEPCKALLDRWLAEMAQRDIRIGPYRRYARGVLGAADLFGDQLKGEVLMVKDEVAAFTFAGWIDQSNASIFVTVSDHDHPGLAYLQRYSIMQRFPGIERFNDGTDAKRPGMRQMKRAFRPVRLHPIYSARSGRS